MNLIDRAIGFISPVRQVERARARLQLRRIEVAASAMSGYEAAKRERAALRYFSASPRTADEDVLPGLDALRARSRQMMMNAPIARGAVQTAVTNVVGAGLRVSAQPDRAALRTLASVSEIQVGAFEDAAQREWRLFNRKEHADIHARLSFRRMQDLVFRSVLVSGDCFVAVVQARKGTPFDFALQVIEADRVCNPNYRSDTETLAGGIEYDDAGTPVAIHVAEIPRGGGAKRNWRRLPMRAPDGAPRVLHLMQQERIGQSRGVPYLAPVIGPLKDLDRYSEAELTAAVLNASIAIVSQNADGAADIAENAARTGQAQPGFLRANIEFEPGMVLEGFAPNEGPKSFAADRPNAGFDPFVQAVLRQVGVALELPFEVLVKHFTASYSAARAALLQAWSFFRVRREWLAEELCQPVYELVLRNAILRGRVAAPGFLEDAAMRAAWSATRWTGPSMGQIQPQTEIRAAREAVEARFASRTRIAAEIFGDDWEAVEDELAWEDERIGGARPGDPLTGRGAPPPVEQPSDAGDAEDETEQERNAA
jgi:lambda family phage portal protein